MEIIFKVYVCLLLCFPIKLDIPNILMDIIDNSVSRSIVTKTWKILDVSLKTEYLLLHVY